MAALTETTPLDLEAPIRTIGTDLAARMPKPRAVSAARVERRMTDMLVKDPALRAALFRFVDVRPACDDAAGRHPPPARAARGRADVSNQARLASNITGKRLATRPVAAIAGAGVKQMAQRFIVGADAKDALPAITKLWKQGVETTVDLLGEATVSEAEADRYMQRCEETLRALAAAATKPGQVNLSVKVSALTPLLRAHAPERGIEGARAAPDAPAARRPRPRRAPARRHGVLRHARGDHRAHARPALASPSSPPARPPASSCRPTWSTRPQYLEELLEWAREHAPRSTRSRSAWSRAPTGTTRSSRPPSTAGRRRCSPTAARATATSRC